MTKKQRIIAERQRITILFGYGFFAILLLIVLWQTVVPWAAMFLEPGVIKHNVALTVVALASVAVLPSLMAYIIGDRSTPKRLGARAHQYNGVMFGFAAYWLSLFLAMAGSGSINTFRLSLPQPWSIIAMAWPIVAIIAILAAVAIAYSRKKRPSTLIIDYRPFQLVFIGSIVATFVYVLSGQLYTFSTIGVITFIYVVLPLLVGLISYRFLDVIPETQMGRITLSGVALTVLFVAVTLTGQLLYEFNQNPVLPLIIGVFVWAAFLWTMSRKALK